MEDEIKISLLPPATTLTGLEEIPIVQGGTTKRTPVNDVRTVQGFAVYDNSEASNISLSAGVFTSMTNNGLESTTKTDKLPTYTSSLFTSNEIDLDNIPEDSNVTVRIVATLVALSPNTEFQTKLIFKNSSGTPIFESVLGHDSFKTAGSRTFSNVALFFRGAVILNGSVELQIEADVDAEAYWNGILITIP